jgi:hypothetical protein
MNRTKNWSVKLMNWKLRMNYCSRKCRSLMSYLNKLLLTKKLTCNCRLNLSNLMIDTKRHWKNCRRLVCKVTRMLSRRMCWVSMLILSNNCISACQELEKSWRVCLNGWTLKRMRFRRLEVRDRERSDS